MRKILAAAPFVVLVTALAMAEAVLSIALAPPAAAAIPISLNWKQVVLPGGGGGGLTLEVAADKSFSEIVFTGPAEKSGVQVIDVPREGVYHWRFLRPSRRGDTAERSSHMSGSIAAFESAGVAGPAPARLTWQAAEGADRYKLIVISGGRKVRELTTMDLSYVVPREAEPSTIEVVPYWHQSRASRTFHFEPSLTIDKPYAAPVVAPVPEPVAAPEPVAEAVPEPAAPAPPAEVPTEVPPAEVPTEVAIAGARRLHHVQIAAGYGKETFRAQKLEHDLNGESSGAFFGGGFWTNPAGGLVFDVRGDYHEFRDTLSDAVAPELDGDFRALRRSRYTLGLNGGFDFLKLFDGTERHQLSLEFASAMVQIPLLAVETADTTPSSDYPLKSATLSFAGAGLTYSVFWQGGALTAFGRRLVNAAREQHTRLGSLLWYGLSAEWYVRPNTSLNLTAQMRVVDNTRCAGDAGICLAQGKVRTNARESFLMLGVGAVRF